MERRAGARTGPGRGARAPQAGRHKKKTAAGRGAAGAHKATSVSLLGVGRVWLVRERALALCVFLRQKRRSGDPREAPNAHAAREDENQEP